MLLKVVTVEYFFQFYILLNKPSYVNVVQILFSLQVAIVSSSLLFEDHAGSIDDQLPLIVVHVLVHRQFVTQDDSYEVNSTRFFGLEPLRIDIRVLQ